MAPHFYVTGFGSLADFIASDADHSTPVYRRFDKLAARNLLYYQSELAHLESLQDKYDIEDAQEVKNREQPDNLWKHIREHAREWAVFSGEVGSPNAASDLGQTPGGDLRWKQRRELAMTIRSVLKEYQEALIQESTLLSMKQPTQQTMTALSNYFHNCSSSTSTPYPVLADESRYLYPPGMTSSQIRSSDYVSLSQQPAQDPLTYILKTHCTRLFRTARPPLLPCHRDTISHNPPHEIVYYSSERVTIAASFITTLVAAALLFLPIYILRHVSLSQPELTLGLIALFTVMFAAAIALLSNARRAEIFGACAAYAAVLVVFVSGDFAGGGG